MAAIPVIDEYTWARIVAKAYLDTSDFKSVLETDPAAAVSRTRLENPEFKIPPDPVKLMDLTYSYDGPPDSVAKLLIAIFQGTTEAQLKGLYTSGELDGQPMELPCGEWINPAGPKRLFEHAKEAVSLADWMRIYAYIWYQMRFGQPQPPPPDNIRLRFEKNPAQTLDKEIAGPLKLTYAPGKPLFTLGDPVPDSSPWKLTDIRDDAGAKNFRHRIRMSC